MARRWAVWVALASGACSTDLFPILAAPGRTGDAGAVDAPRDSLASTDASDGPSGGRGGLDAASDSTTGAAGADAAGTGGLGALDAGEDRSTDAGDPSDAGDTSDASDAGDAGDASDGGAQLTVRVDQNGFFVDVGGANPQVGPIETETWVDAASTVVCTVLFSAAAPAVTLGCPACSFGWEFDPVDARVGGTDCASAGQSDGGASRRGRVAYGYQETAVTPPSRTGVLWGRSRTGAWEIVGTIQIGDDPAAAADYSASGAWPDPFPALP